MWKLYCWLMVFLIAIGVLLAGSETHWRLHVVDWLNLLFMIVGLIGVFGYAYRRRIASRSFWLLLGLVAIMYQAIFSFLLDQQYGAVPATSTADGLVTFVPLIPMFIALYLYVYKSDLFDN